MIKTIGNVLGVLAAICIVIGTIQFIPKLEQQLELEREQTTIMVKTEINKRLEEECNAHWYNPFYEVTDGTGWFTIDGIEVKYVYDIKNGEYVYMYEYNNTNVGITDFIDTVKRAIEG